MHSIDQHRLQLGEGPGYDPGLDLAWWFDIPARRLYLRAMQSGQTQLVDLPFAASAMSHTQDGTSQLLVGEGGLYLRDPVLGQVTLHLAVEGDDPGTRSNDARVHPSGALWFSTMGWSAQKAAGSLYHYRKGRVQRLQAGITIPNAICFSPDGRTGYFADTALGTIFRVALDPATGLPQAAPAPFLTQFDGGPDGAVTDAAGNLWVALWGGAQVAGFAPDGQAIGRLPVPVLQPSCPAFVGADARRMLITSAREGQDAARLDRHPLEGATLLMDLEFSGRFDPRVAL